jgi:hypothetical protein
MTRQKKIALGLLAGLPCLCCFGGFGYVQYQVSSVGGGLDSQLAQAHTLGIPVVPSELKRSVPNSQNAAREYNQLIAMLFDGSPAKVQFDTVALGFGPKATPAQRADAAAAYRKIGPQLALLDRAAEKPHCDFQKDWSQGMSLMFPEYAQMKQFEKVMGYRATAQSAAGDWEGSLKTMRRMFQMSRHVGEEPILIGLLVQIATESIAHMTFRDVIKQNRSNPRFLEQARELTANLGDLPDFRYALRGEVVSGRSSIYQIRNMGDLSTLGGAPSAENGAVKAIFFSKSVRKAFDRKLVEAYNKLFVMLPSKKGDWKGTVKAAREHEVWIERDKSVFNLMNQILFPVFSQAATAVGRTQAQRNLTRTSIELFRELAATGQLPKALPKGSWALDPFVDRPFVYRPSGRGFLIYSVDQDLMDNGGATTSTDGGGRDLAVDMR